jgi:hypothetical protein
VLAERIAPSQLHLWLYAMAAIFFVATWTSTTSFAAARRHPENREFFEGFDLGGTFWTSWGWPLAVVGALLGFGAAVQAVGPGGGLALAAILATLAALGGQLFLLHRWWQGSVQEPED